MTDIDDKLIRDKIPASICATGQDCVVETLDDARYDRALRAKLVEEAREVAAATGNELIGEIADVLEVVDALCVAHGLDPAPVRAAQDGQRKERGGFALRRHLSSIE